jgi:hypothetical protein
VHRGRGSWPQQTTKRGLQVCKTLGRRPRTQEHQRRRSQPLWMIRRGIGSQDHYKRIATTRTLTRGSQPQKTLGRGRRT